MWPRILTLSITPHLLKQGLVVRGAPSIRDMGFSVPLRALLERELDFDLLGHILRRHVFAGYSCEWVSLSACVPACDNLARACTVRAL